MRIPREAGPNASSKVSKETDAAQRLDMEISSDLGVSLFLTILELVKTDRDHVSCSHDLAAVDQFLSMK